MAKILSILPVNKTVVIYSPIERSETLVRTGTIGDGSCFFHSLLHATEKRYTCMPVPKRRNFVSVLRAKMADKVSKEEWEVLGSGLVSKIPFQSITGDFLTDVQNILTNGERPKNIHTAQILSGKFDHQLLKNKLRDISLENDIFITRVQGR